MSYTVGRSTDTAQPNAEKPGEKLSLGVAARLSRYLQVLTQARKMGKDTISSQELADYTHVNSTQIRRDLSGFGKFGKRGVGYNIESLVTQIRKILRTAGQHNIALFGAGHLGIAIATSDIFADHGFRVVAMFDVDERRAAPPHARNRCHQALGVGMARCLQHRLRRADLDQPAGIHDGDLVRRLGHHNGVPVRRTHQISCESPRHMGWRTLS